jgi:hypothetical protein
MLIRKYIILLTLIVLCMAGSQSRMNDDFMNNTPDNSTPVNEIMPASLSSEIESQSQDECNSCNNDMIDRSASLLVDPKCSPKGDRVNGKMNLEILVANDGKILLRDVRLNATLPPNTAFKESRYLDPSKDGILKYPTRMENDDGTTKELRWFLGDLQTGQNKTIELVITYDDANKVDCKETVVQAWGYAIDKAVHS